MNLRQQRRVLILLVAAAICLVMTRFSYGGRATGERLTLWYAETDLKSTVMETLLSRCRKETGLEVSAVPYDDEQALAAAFEEGRPDLLFCSHVRAGLLGARGGLAAVDGEALPETGGVETMLGRAFFPLGSRVPLFVENTALAGESYPSLEALLDAAGDTLFLASDDWAELMHTALISRGYAMQGDLRTDGEEPAFRRLYNRIAKGSYAGALISLDKGAAEYVLQGALPCAIVRSTALAGLRGETFSVRPMPLPEGGTPRYTAELMGFAMPEGAHKEAALFLRWAEQTAADGRTALGAGLVPVTAQEPGGEQNSLESTLRTLSDGESLYFAPADADFYQNRESAGRALCRTLALLS